MDNPRKRFNFEHRRNVERNATKRRNGRCFNGFPGFRSSGRDTVVSQRGRDAKTRVVFIDPIEVSQKLVTT